ncbi:MAG TPA: hypothetical protein VFT29_01370 [Gemmatimonadaceae bacterium]|nr:hypothetical protein [Gemmatimonadaceae bacterium]
MRVGAGRAFPVIRRAALLLSVSALALVACDQPQTEAARRARERAAAVAAAARRDSIIPPDVIIPFVPPPAWETVKLASGVQYHQPPGFGLRISDASLTSCDTTTLRADSPVLQTAFAERWPLTLAVRRGDLTRLAFVNGFTLDSVVIGTHGERPERGDSTRLRRGEGWQLLTGRTTARGGEPLDILLGTVRYPGGCYLVVAARGVEINADTLGLVLSTVRFTLPVK